MKKIFYILIALSTILSCSKDNNVIDEVITNLEGNVRAIVVSEGQFGFGSSSLTVLTTDGKVIDDVFKNANNRTMGDVAQSITKIGNYYYVAVNNSKKVEVIDCNTFKSVEEMTINENVIPMYVEHIGGDSVAVTTMNGNLLIMDINHGKSRDFVRRSVWVGGNLGKSIISDGKLFTGGTFLSVFDIQNISSEGKRLVDGISNMANNSKIVKDKNGMLWVLTAHRVYCVNPKTEEVVHSVDVSSLNINDWIACIDISPCGEKVYFNSKRKVYEINVDNPVTPTTPIIDPSIGDNERTVFHMSVSKENTVFMCEVVYGSLLLTRVYEYNMKGEILSNFKAGIFSSSIYYN